MPLRDPPTNPESDALKTPLPANQTLTHLVEQPEDINQAADDKLSTTTPTATKVDSSLSDITDTPAPAPQAGQSKEAELPDAGKEKGSWADDLPTPKVSLKKAIAAPPKVAIITQPLIVPPTPAEQKEDDEDDGDEDDYDDADEGESDDGRGVGSTTGSYDSLTTQLEGLNMAADDLRLLSKDDTLAPAVVLTGFSKVVATSLEDLAHHLRFLHGEVGYLRRVTQLQSNRIDKLLAGRAADKKLIEALTTELDSDRQMINKKFDTMSIQGTMTAGPLTRPSATRKKIAADASTKQISYSLDDWNDPADL